MMFRTWLAAGLLVCAAAVAPAVAQLRMDAWATAPTTRLMGSGPPSITSGTAGQEYYDRLAGHIWRRTINSWDNETVPTQATIKAVPDLMNSVFFVGVNYPGMDTWFNGSGDVAGQNYLVPMQSDLVYLRSRGVQVVRFQFRWEHLFPNGVTGAMDPTYLSLMQQACGWMAALSMGCILDMHNYAVYNQTNSSSNQPQVGAPGAPTYAQLAADWAELATVAQNWPGVIGFDTMNEPVSVPDVVAMQQAIITAIRGTGATQPIAVEYNGFSSAQNWPNGGAAMFGLTDPLHKLIFEAHDYPDCDHSGTHASWALQSTNPSLETDGTSCPATPVVTLTTGQTTTQEFLALAAANGHPRVWLGEVGAATDKPWRTSVDNMISAVESYGGFVTIWSAGVGYNSNLYYAGNEPPGIEPAGVIDTPPVGNFEKYTGFTAIPYGLTGPSIGTAGLASANFSIIVHGYLPSAVTFKPNGGGGTFTPATITIPAGFSGDSMPNDLNYSFTYTPVSDASAVYNISTTNNGGLIDPVSIPYSTYADTIAATVAAAGGTIVADYTNWAAIRSTISPVVTLRRGTDGAVQSFAPLSGSGSLDPVALSNWAGSSPLFLASHADIAPNSYVPFAVSTTNSHYPAPSFADQPAWSATALNNLPGEIYGTSRTSGPAPIAGQAHACVLVVLKASSSPFVAFQSPDNSTVWEIPARTGGWFGIKLASTDTETVLGTMDTSNPHVIDTCFDAGTVSLSVDGTKTTASVTETVLPNSSGTSPFGLANTIDIGFFNNYPVYYRGTVGDILVTTGAFSAAQRNAIEAAYGAHYGIAIAAPP